MDLAGCTSGVVILTVVDRSSGRQVAVLFIAGTVESSLSTRSTSCSSVSFICALTSLLWSVGCLRGINLGVMKCIAA